MKLKKVNKKFLCDISFKQKLQDQKNLQHVKNQISIALFQPSNLC